MMMMNKGSGSGEKKGSGWVDQSKEGDLCELKKNQVDDLDRVKRP
jgi:hypothetical protein